MLLEFPSSLEKVVLCGYLVWFVNGRSDNQQLEFVKSQKQSEPRHCLGRSLGVITEPCDLTSIKKNQIRAFTWQFKKPECCLNQIKVKLLPLMMTHSLIHLDKYVLYNKITVCYCYTLTSWQWSNWLLFYFTGMSEFHLFYFFYSLHSNLQNQCDKGCLSFISLNIRCIFLVCIVALAAL